MAISVLNIASSGGNATAANTIVGGSGWGGTAPAPSDIIIMPVVWYSITASAVTIVSCTSATLTWTQIGVTRSQAIDATNTQYIAVFRAVGNGNKEAITVTLSGVCIRGLSRPCYATGCDVGGTNGSNAIVQSPFDNTHTSATPAITMASWADAVNNAGLAMFIQQGISTGATPKASPAWTEINKATNANEIMIYLEWILGQDTAPNFNSPQNAVYTGIAVELKDVGGGGGSVPTNSNLIGSGSSRVGAGGLVG